MGILRPSQQETWGTVVGHAFRMSSIKHMEINQIGGQQSAGGEGGIHHPWRYYPLILKLGNISIARALAASVTPP